MNRWDFVKIKSLDKYGVLMIPSRQIDMFGHRSLNNVMLKDKTLVAVRDDDIEKIELEVEE